MKNNSTILTDSAKLEGWVNPVHTWYDREPTIARFALGVVLLTPLLLIISIFDDRTLNGISVWTKPLKFNLSIIVYLATLTWFSGWINRSCMSKLWYRTCVFIICGTLFFMLPWLYGASIIGEPAHFNKTHPILAPMYSMMGVVSVVFTMGALFYSLLIFTSQQVGISTYFRHSVAWSLLISFVFTVVMAGELASMDSHWIGGTESDAAALMFMGWSRDGGDLRVAHFFSLHAMQIIPIIAAIALPKALKPHPRKVAAALSFAYCCFIFFVYFQAKGGRPFLPWLG